MDEQKVKDTLKWAILKRAESSFEPTYYYWPPEGKRVLNLWTMFSDDSEKGKHLLLGVIGQSGVGKTALLYALRDKLVTYVKENVTSLMEEKALMAYWFRVQKT